jgi:ParB/RepB/Spo0J family partition protein
MGLQEVPCLSQPDVPHTAEMPEDRSAQGKIPPVSRSPHEARGIQKMNVEQVVKLPCTALIPNQNQPRSAFGPLALSELAASIREKGVLQPILVRPTETKGLFEIIAGERRYRAAKMAGLKSVPAIVREETTENSLEISLIENIQRVDLNPIELAKSYRELVRKFGYKQEQLALKVGKSRSAIANHLRLLRLPVALQELVQCGKLSEGMARTLIGVPDAESRAKLLIANGVNVREAEKASAHSGRSPRKDTAIFRLSDGRDFSNVRWHELNGLISTRETELAALKIAKRRFASVPDEFSRMCDLFSDQDIRAITRAARDARQIYRQSGHTPARSVNKLESKGHADGQSKAQS